MKVLQKGNRKAPGRTFAVAGDGTVTATTGTRRDRRGFYVAIADVDVEGRFRARTCVTTTEEEIRGWLHHLLNVASDDVLITTVSVDTLVERTSRSAAAEPLLGDDVALLEPPKPRGAASAARSATAAGISAVCAGSSGCGSATHAVPRVGTAGPP